MCIETEMYADKERGGAIGGMVIIFFFILVLTKSVCTVLFILCVKRYIKNVHNYSIYSFILIQIFFTFIQ